MLTWGVGGRVAGGEAGGAVHQLRFCLELNFEWNHRRQLVEVGSLCARWIRK